MNVVRVTLSQAIHVSTDARGNAVLEFQAEPLTGANEVYEAIERMDVRDSIKGMLIRDLERAMDTTLIKAAIEDNIMRVRTS